MSISAFVYLVGIPVGITSSANGLNNCVTNSKIKRCKSIKKEQEAWPNSIISKIEKK